MAIIHADNFSVYGTTTSLLTDGVYAEAATINTLQSDPDGVSSGKVLRLDANGFVRYALPATVTTIGVSARLYVAVLPTTTDDAPCIRLRDGSNVNLCYLSITSTGGIIISTGIGSTQGTIIAQTTGPVVSAGSWFHIEWKHFTSATVGTSEVRVEGATVINATGLNTGAGPIAQMTLGKRNFASASQLAYWKDFVIWNTSGTANNNFLGSVLVTTLTPTSDFSLNWTPSSGATGFDILDNIPPVDTTFISAGVAPIPAAYKGGLSDLPTTVTSVKAVVTKVRAAKSDGGDGSMQVGIISDPAGTPATGLGADRPITTSQAYWQDIFELDPKTAAAWLPVAVNAALIQINRTT